MRLQIVLTVLVWYLFVNDGDGKERRGLSLLKSSEENRKEFNQTFPGCWLGNHFYMVGDKWSPEIEPYGVMECVKCQCAQIVKRSVVQLEGKVLCRNIKSDCPKVTCRNPRLRPRTCCKICHDNDALFEDQFSDAGVGLVPATLSTPADSLKKQGMSALLTGSQHRSKQPVRTNAVSWIRIVHTTGNGFVYHIRFSRLKHPFALRFLDRSGSVLIEVKLSVGTKRKGTTHGEVRGIPYRTMETITKGHVWCSIPTLRHKDGEISGPLLLDDISTPALFEAILSPNMKNGFGGHVTIFYDRVTSHASYVIKIQGTGLVPAGSDVFVTFEKDTDIIYQHLLRLSELENKLIGRFKLDRKMSRQVARGRLQCRVTSRTGETITGVIRPRLVRSDILSMISIRNRNVTGFMVGRIEEDGRFTYKVSLDGVNDVQSITIQRLTENARRWKTFVKVKQRQWSRQSSPHGTVTITGVYRKLNVDDVAAILDGEIRLRLVSDEITTHSAFEQISLNNVDLLKAIQPGFCDDSVMVWYKVTPDCTLHLYMNTMDDVTVPGGISAVLKSVFDPVYGEESHEFQISRDQPEVTLVNISTSILRDLNAGRAFLHVTTGNPSCDTWRAILHIPNDCWRHSITDSASSHTALNELDENPDLELIYTCHHEGKFYPHAASWVPERSDACVTCRCERGTTHCDDVLCPTPHCARPIKRQGECCPVCEDDNETEQKPIGSCFYQGDKRWHLFGTSWHPYVPPFGYSKCSMCTCMPETGGVNCSRLACPVLDCPNYQRVRVNREDCCQTCQDQPKNSLIPTPKRDRSQDDCTFGTTSYKHGDKWHPVLTPFGTMTCYVCSCKNGKIRCRKKKCPMLKCKRQYRPTGQCCPICRGKSNDRRQNQQKQQKRLHKLDMDNAEVT